MYVRGPGEWLVNPNNHQPNTLLADAVKALPWLPGTPYPWFAGEFDGMAKQQDPEA
jgi:hypothetical protein